MISAPPHKPDVTSGGSFFGSRVSVTLDESFSILSLPALELDPNFETHVFAFLHWNYLRKEYRTQCSFLHARMDLSLSLSLSLFLSHASHAAFIYDKPKVKDKSHTHGCPD
jgi:hypothetical protein